MWLFLAFVGVPLIEIALFIQIGGAIGLTSTLLIVILTAVLGTFLVKNQGRIALANLQRSFSELNDPTEPLAHGAMILLSGALLLTPGFFTDAVGFSLLIPPVREAVYRFLRGRVRVQSFSMGSMQGGKTYHPGTDDVIDGDFVEIDPDKRPTHRPSGWTKH
ncbi:MAG: FxsA family protein [Rhodobacteraceae bacterium]|nr:FxsA family protein [Paracoccaceae bacterium]